MCSQVVSLSESSHWEAFLNRLPVMSRDIYSTPEYYSIYERNGDGKAMCFLYEKDGNFAIYPFLINRINDLGFDLPEDYFDIQGAYGYNGVVSSSIEKSFITGFYNDFNNFCRDSGIIAEFTRFHPLLENHRFSEQNMQILQNRFVVYLDLKNNYDEIWSGCYSGNNRNMIRKAEKLNLTILESCDEAEYITFFKLYSKTMDNVKADPYLYFNKKYFLNIYNLLGVKQRLLLAIINQKIIGGMILLIDGDYANYHLSARDASCSTIPAGNLLLDKSIQLAQQSGHKTMHFGGGLKNNTEDRLFKFKAGFSRTYKPFYIGKKIHHPEIYDQITVQWSHINPGLAERHHNTLLKYRLNETTTN